MRALREPEAPPACAPSNTRLPLRWPLALAVGCWAYLKYTETTLAIGGNGAGTKLGLGGHLTRYVVREAKCQIE